MYNSTNPTTTYLGTTWEELPTNKYILTGNTPLQTGGSNSVSIGKSNLPNVKLQIDSFSLTRGTMEITGKVGNFRADNGDFVDAEGAFYKVSSAKRNGAWDHFTSAYSASFQASRTWSGSTSSTSPYTTTLGNGTPFKINPEYITIKAWKRLS